MVINRLVTQALFSIDEKIKVALILKNQIVHRQRCIDENSAGFPADMGGFQFKRLTWRANLFYCLSTRHDRFNQVRAL